MGGVEQQVNLYRGREALAASGRAARQLLMAGVGALVMVLALAAAGELELRSLTADRQAMAANLQDQQALRAQLNEKLAGMGADPFLDAELARMRETRTRLSENLTAMRRHNTADSRGFSAFFAGLARNTVEGLWFNNVGLSRGGAELLLKGRAVEPALVPRLLQVLAAEPVFIGRTFRKVSFERREQGDIVDFELRSAPAEGLEDAG